MSLIIPRRDGRFSLGSQTAVAATTALWLTVGGLAWSAAREPQVLRLATTTSTVDTGLLQSILPEFERRCGCRVDVIAVGTGQALELGRRGDVDVLLVHAREAESKFVAEGHGVRRDDVMYNDFVVVGPEGDPAGIVKTRRASLALSAIAAATIPFASRGDRSGTHTKELELWTSAGLIPASTASWYLSVGQGMGETLTFANQRQAYALTDRATWLSMRDRLNRLRLLFGGDTLTTNPDADLRNDYGVIAVNPKTHPGVRASLATQFVEWLLSGPCQRRIGAFGLERFGQPQFYPNSDELKASREIRVEIGTTVRTFSVEALRAFPRVTLANHEVIGVKRGSLGRITWTGVSLKDLLLSVEPHLAAPAHAGATITAISTDGWTAVLGWAELFGTVPRGEGLYLAKGCNECHGRRAGGSAPVGKRPAPRLAGRIGSSADSSSLVRDPARHAGITEYTVDRLSTDDLLVILGWLKNPSRTGSDMSYQVHPASRAVVLAYERDGQPMTGRDGLIQLVVGPDQFASRYAHWVSAVRVH
jgi:tungstate transport system substrate-binding protein